MNINDPKAIKILLKYNPLVENSISKEEYKYAIDKGLMFEKTSCSHDELIEKLFEEKRNTLKKHCTDLFLSSLSSSRLEYRCGLSVFSIMQSFPKHQFILAEGESYVKLSPCKLCSNFKFYKNIDYSFINCCRFSLGGLASHGLAEYYLYLEQHNKLQHVNPKEDDFRIFIEILEILSSADEDETVKKNIQRKISKIKGFKSNGEQRQVLLETLGYCSILETEKHRGLLDNYTNLSVAPSKTHASDWNYPVDWWVGNDGINPKAFQFWFGSYPELGAVKI